ncbi:uncharacterized protein (DUF58 family) [Barrientosiimonas humi]|uniref:Uncharacterized protein (DUF58 family) n=2 Tax=Barrientosiimonas TaxID=1535207 RepID=A0A542XDY0_9MICO|nr:MULTISPECIES: DUF58 domain-containing protein [Barrientosiimonas]TQL34030.1 uncharacterized protein (DUF58 family) [Barrientosiimonas humi]BDZ59003.1 lipoprotein [Barrientosiimonas endolithica]CAG7574020.1 hypothetical protein BH39T_PBIAJDOK_02662 [Barrientosiimonas humi]
MALTWRAVALTAFGLVAVVLWPSFGTVWWWLLLVVVVAALDVALAVSPRRLLLGRSADTQVRQGEPTETTLTVRNPTGRTVRGTLRDAWQPSAGATGERHRLRLPGGEQRRFRTALRPTRRGDRKAVAVTVRSLGPLGVAGRQASREVPGVVRSLPPFHSRRHLPSRLAMLRQIDGRSAVRTRGQGTEFDSLRDYVEGDDVRSIDWRATARRQHLVVRTWQPERDRRIVLLLDTSRTSAGRVGDVPRLDAGMDAALLLAALASRAGDRVQLLAGDRRIRARVTSSTDRNQLLHELVTAMAPLEPALVEANWPRLVGAVNALSRRRALVVLLTPLEPAAIEEGLLPVLPALLRHHRVVLASVADPSLQELASARGDAAQTYDAAAAERSTALKQRIIDALTGVGVTVLDAPPEQLPVALADHYLLLKRQGLL